MVVYSLSVLRPPVLHVAVAVAVAVVRGSRRARRTTVRRTTVHD